MGDDIMTSAKKKVAETEIKKEGVFLVVEQYASAIRRPRSQKKILIGLGLRKIGDKKQLKDTPMVRGMIRKLPHMVRVLSS